MVILALTNQNAEETELTEPVDQASVAVELTTHPRASQVRHLCCVYNYSIFRISTFQERQAASRDRDNHENLHDSQPLPTSTADLNSPIGSKVSLRVACITTWF